MSQYSVTVTREDGMWTAVVDGLPRGVIGAIDVARFADVRHDVRELIADLTDSHPVEIEVEWRYLVGNRDVSNEVRRYLDAEEDVRRLTMATGVRDEERLNVVRELAGPLSQRTLADMLGVSHQRVNQLAKAAGVPGHRAAAAS